MRQLHGTLASLAATAAVATATCCAEGNGNAAEAARRQFQAIVSRLDVGGDFLFVGNGEGIVQGLWRELLDADAAGPPTTPEERATLAAAARVETFLRRNGVYALKGLGISAAPLPDGRHAIKAFVSRDYVESSLPFWRATVGWLPRRLAALDFIPGDVALAAALTSDPGAFWKLVNAAMTEAADPVQAAAFARRRDKADAILGVPLDRIVESLRDELVLAVRFRADREIALPTAFGPVSIPAPEILFGISVKSQMLRGALEARLAHRGMVLAEVAVGEATMRYATEPLPGLLPVQPCMATESGFFLLGSSTNIVADALAAYRHKHGLPTRPAFIKSLGSLPLVNNGVVYISPAMTDVTGRFQRARVAAWAPPERPLLRRLLQTMTALDGGLACTAVIQNWKSGVMLSINANRGGKAMLRRLAARPLRTAGNLTWPPAGHGVRLPFAAPGPTDPGPMHDPGAGGE